ncbi:putative Protein bicaudal C-like protein 1 [Hypsibius exemplaris]|uniref:Uncharacterized protein n=1 Tax=Hypsibius exemplaris TaxID=2072580 RepID=A0A1W0WWM9_HYPEX|nr:putative Protein bicaudal C-like protein 1 [Hypsibius exemplaris]
MDICASLETSVQKLLLEEDSLFGGGSSSDGSISPKSLTLSPSMHSKCTSSAATHFSNDFSMERPDSIDSGHHDTEPECLNEREGRVVLRMEVSHKEHSALIGAGGQVVRDMRAANSCLIHYPDASATRSLQSVADAGKMPYPNLHENEVSVRGKLPNVIAGAHHVRDSIPFSFTYYLPAFVQLGPTAMESIFQVETHFGIEVVVKPSDRGPGQQVSIRGPQSSRTLVGVETLCSFFAPQVDKAAHVVIQTMCVHPTSQSSMIDLCDGERRLARIGQYCRVGIAFPDPRRAGSGSNDKQTMTLTGNIRSVAAAWIMLMSMLPVTLRVFVSHDMDYQRYENYMKQLGVSFLVPKKEPGPQDHPYVELKSYEGNITAIYMAYQRLTESTSSLASQKIHIRSTEQRLDDLELSVYKIALPPQPLAMSADRKPRYVLSPAQAPPSAYPSYSHSDPFHQSWYNQHRQLYPPRLYPHQLQQQPSNLRHQVERSSGTWKPAENSVNGYPYPLPMPAQQLQQPTVSNDTDVVLRALAKAYTDLKNQQLEEQQRSRARSSCACQDHSHDDPSIVDAVVKGVSTQTFVFPDIESAIKPVSLAPVPSREEKKRPSIVSGVRENSLEQHALHSFTNQAGGGPGKTLSFAPAAIPTSTQQPQIAEQLYLDRHFPSLPAPGGTWNHQYLPNGAQQQQQVETPRAAGRLQQMYQNDDLWSMFPNQELLQTMFRFMADPAHPGSPGYLFAKPE